MKNRKHKMDAHLVSKQKWELEYVAEKMRGEGYSFCKPTHVIEAIQEVGKSRRKVYKLLRNDLRKW